MKKLRKIIKTGLSVLVILLTFVLTGRTSDKALISNLIFSHSLHVDDQEIDCITCHTEINNSTKTDDRNLPTMDICSDCHDVEDEKNCGQCHRDPEEPLPVELTTPSLSFNHKRHLKLNFECQFCHELSKKSDTGEPSPKLPDKFQCMGCHDDLRASQDCGLCHTAKINLADIHPAGWRHQHAEAAAMQADWCQTCHQQESYCVNCHRGDNTTGNIHDLNYQYTHGLDARGKEIDCRRCHEQKIFCNGCHESENLMPLNHSTLDWRTNHGRAAHKDIENCASCHDSDDPICARAGCHLDSDGLRGTDAQIHPDNLSRFDIHGPWHDDNGYFCFDCHTSTGQPGIGFCGYCHRVKD